MPWHQRSGRAMRRWANCRQLFIERRGGLIRNGDGGNVFWKTVAPRVFFVFHAVRSIKRLLGRNIKSVAPCITFVNFNLESIKVVRSLTTSFNSTLSFLFHLCSGLFHIIHWYEESSGLLGKCRWLASKWFALFGYCLLRSSSGRSRGRGDGGFNYTLTSSLVDNRSRRIFGHLWTNLNEYMKGIW